MRYICDRRTVKINVKEMKSYNSYIEIILKSLLAKINLSFVIVCFASPTFYIYILFLMNLIASVYIYIYIYIYIASIIITLNKMSYV